MVRSIPSLVSEGFQKTTSLIWHASLRNLSAKPKLWKTSTVLHWTPSACEDHVSLAGVDQVFQRAHLSSEDLGGSLVDDPSADLELGEPGRKHELEDKGQQAPVLRSTLGTYSCRTGAHDEDVNLA